MKPDWNTLTHVDKIDTLRHLVLEGWSCSQMATVFTNATKNAVLAFIYRYNLRGTDEDVAAVRAHWAGHVYTKVNPTPRRARFNRAKDPITRAVIDHVNAHGFALYDIAALAGVNPYTIANWRRGIHSARPYLARCVAQAVDQLQAEKDAS